MRGENVWSSGFVGLVLLCLLACRTATLEKGAEEVTASRNPAPAGCTSLGYLTGKGGGTFGGAYISNESLIEYALNDLRNQAAELGANYLHHDPPQLGSGDGTTTTATMTGTAYRCSGSTESSASPQAAQPQPAPAGAHAQRAPPPSPPPTGAAGFAFGKSIDESAAACTGAGHEWTPGEENHFKCSGAPSDVGFPATVLVRFCSDKLCGLSISTAPESEEGKAWISTFADLKETLVRKYGAPAKDDKVRPVECKTKELYACLTDGRAQFLVDWRWPTKERVRAAMKKTAEGPRIQLQYFKVDKGPNSDAL
jgi:hypothetical protein